MQVLENGRAADEKVYRDEVCILKKHGCRSRDQGVDM